MSVQGFINRIRRQVGLPATPPNIAADELQFDPVAGLFYYMPDGGGAPQVVQHRMLSGMIIGNWEEEASLEFVPDPMHTFPGTFVVGRQGVGDYYLDASGAGVPAGGLQQHIPLSGTAGKYNNATWVFQDTFNNRTIYAEVDDSLPSGAPGTSIAITIRRSDTSVKQELNGRFRLRLFY